MVLSPGSVSYHASGEEATFPFRLCCLPFALCYTLFAPTPETGQEEDGLKRWESAFLLVGILLVALSVRVVGLGWGEGQPIHPDEEFLRQVTVAVQWPNSLTLYLDTSRSPLNPYNRGYGFFVYGTFPLFLTRAVGEALDQGCRNGEAVSLLSRWLAPVLLGNPAVCWPGAFSGTGTRHLGRLLAALS